VSYGFDYQTGIDLTEEELNSTHLRYQSQFDGGSAEIMADGEAYHYNFGTYDNVTDEVFAHLQRSQYLTITRERDLEIRKIDSLYLTENCSIAEKIMNLWNSPFIHPVNIKAVNGKMILQCQTDELSFFMANPHSPEYFFEYDFNSETFHYLGFYSDYYDNIQFIIKK
jgi:hypothetical protein